MLQLYNTRTQKKEIFTPLTAQEVGLYVCGMTVYDYCHIGHARIWVVFDILIRYLKQRAFKVNYVRNITDIDDKIIQRAQEIHQSVQTLTEQMIQAMHQDLASLNVLPPTQEPHATQHIAPIIQLIQTLLEKGYAYHVPQGDVYYRVNQFPPYGQLSHQRLDELMSGARISIDENKNHPLDFVLWKRVTEGPKWPSPWGDGRPGWHIECSAMALKHLGPSFDIHGGGADLQFPHHQNEIAQSEAATGQTFVNTWMHVGFVQLNQEKMSKSKGNFLTVRSLLQRYSGEVIRYFLMTSHYRNPITYLEEHLQNAQKALKRLYSALNDYQSLSSATVEPNTLGIKYEHAFYKALDDDLNTPVALSILFELLHEIHRLGPGEQSCALVTQLKKLGAILGLLQDKPRDFLNQSNKSVNTQWIEEQITRRNNARAMKQWRQADHIRDNLSEQGVILKDTAQGTQWHIE